MAAQIIRRVADNGPDARLPAGQCFARVGRPARCFGQMQYHSDAPVPPDAPEGTEMMAVALLQGEKTL
jgi:hypothetical protein